jgi:multisubunit Na+/H+ antiporter MnhB subunit
MVCGTLSVVLFQAIRVDRQEVRQRCRGKLRMLELTIYGLVGLAAMLVVAFYFAYADEFLSTREMSSFDLINNPHLSDTHMIGSGTNSPTSSPRI